MSKIKRYGIVMVLICLSLFTTACQGEQKESDSSMESKSFPGTYTVPDGWTKAEEHSTEEKIFYVKEGHENDEQPDNISINAGTNRYAMDEHTSFKDAIMKQLMVQIDGQPDTMLYGDGTYTEQDYPVYTFTIDEESLGVVTKQYYIVGDYQYCLIHLTNYSGEENLDEAAQHMMNSFVWDSTDDSNGNGESK